MSEEWVPVCMVCGATIDVWASSKNIPYESQGHTTKLKCRMPGCTAWALFFMPLTSITAYLLDPSIKSYGRI